MQPSDAIKQRQNGQTCYLVRISVSDVQMCDGNAQKSSQGVNALVTSVTDTNQLLPHKVTISASNKAAKMCKQWSYDIEVSDSLFVSTVLCRTATD